MPTEVYKDGKGNFMPKLVLKSVEEKHSQKIKGNDINWETVGKYSAWTKLELKVMNGESIIRAGLISNL